jgi:hypothetical protein
MADLDNPFDKYDTSTALVWIGSAGGAISYGLSKVTDFDLVTEIASGSPELAGGAFLLAGGAALAGDLGLVELGDD